MSGIVRVSRFEAQTPEPLNKGRDCLFGVVAAVCTLWAAAASAEIYRWTDAQGKVHFSDRDLSTGAAEVVDLGPVNTFEGVSVEPLQGQSPSGTAQVVMYSTPTCPACKSAKRYFQQQGIPFTEHNIRASKKARREFERLDGIGVPLILVGNQRMSGFSAERFRVLYQP